MQLEDAAKARLQWRPEGYGGQAGFTGKLHDSAHGSRVQGAHPAPVPEKPKNVGKSPTEDWGTEASRKFQRSRTMHTPSLLSSPSTNTPTSLTRASVCVCAGVRGCDCTGIGDYAKDPKFWQKSDGTWGFKQ